MDLDLPESLRAFRDEVRTWLAEHLVGTFADHRGVGFSWDDAAWDVRLEWDRELAAGGWLCIGWPSEYGGRDATVDEQLVFQLEYSRADAPYRAGVQGQDLLGPTLLAFGTDEQKTRFLPKIAGAEELWGQGFSEPGAGSDLASLRTRAVRDARIMEWNGRRLMSAIKGRGGEPDVAASVSKVFASTVHQRMGELGMRAEGSASELVGSDYQLDRLQRAMLASRAESIYGGTTQIQLNLLAERTLGLPREPR